MRIVFAASEGAPFSKSGGLGDVVWGLSTALARKRHKVSVFLPFYSKTKRTVLDMYEFVDSFEVAQGQTMIRANILKDTKEKVDFYFVECAQYFEREGLYGYQDDSNRFAFFCLAVRKAIMRLNLQPDVVHVHDWQTAILPLLLADVGIRVRSLLTIHNPAFQGYLNPYNLGEMVNLASAYYNNGLLRFNDQVSLLKGGITTCDAISTVSRTHAQELLSDFNAFNGLGYVLHNRENDMFGIVNGLDYASFSPESDATIYKTYDKNSFKEGKREIKRELFKAIGFSDVESDVPVFGLVSRLTSQKGIDRVLRIIPKIVNRNARLVVLGQGEWDIEQNLKYMAKNYPENIKIYLGYNEALSHLVYAGSDFFLMPSKFEPCGLGQIIAMHYGTLPIVSKVGGLNDTVNSYYDSQENATGFSFASWDENCFDYTIDYVVDMYYTRRDEVDRLIVNAMSVDFSWDRQVKQYIDLYKMLLSR